MKILSIALIGRHSQPLFIQSYTVPQATAEEDLKWHFAAHTSLDVFEEREAGNARPADHYVGLLQTMDDYACYGYQTSTRLRIVLSLALTEETVRDNDIKTIFRAIHNAYISYLANPFNEAIQDNQTSVEYIQPPIRSRGFTKKLEQIANAQNE